MMHPYTEFEQTRLWQAIDSVIIELERNQDVELSTAREYVIGYLCQQLAARQVVTPASLANE
jgi:hypothetical protein